MPWRRRYETAARLGSLKKWSPLSLRQKPLGMGMFFGAGRRKPSALTALKLNAIPATRRTVRRGFAAEKVCGEGLNVEQAFKTKILGESFRGFFTSRKLLIHCICPSAGALGEGPSARVFVLPGIAIFRVGRVEKTSHFRCRRYLFCRGLQYRCGPIETSGQHIHLRLSARCIRLA